MATQESADPDVSFKRGAHAANALAAVLPERGSRRHHGFGFLVVAFTFLTLAAFTTVPTPLYALDQARDHFSEFMLTVIFAAYAAGVIGSLFLAGHLSDWHGRKRLLIPAAALMVLSAVVFLISKSVPGLLVARVLTGVSIGLTLATATAYLAELHAGHRPQAAPTRAQAAATTVNMGGLGVGALIAGVLAQWAGDPLTVPYLVFLTAALVALVGVALSPETREPVRPRPRYRPQRVSLPREARGDYYAASLSAFMVFATVGLFAGLAGLFLAVSLHHPSHALLGAVLFAFFTAGVGAQLATMGWPERRELAAGATLMILGLALVVIAVWLPSPSLALFIIGGAISGAGSGAIFKGAIGTVIGIAPAETRAEALAGTYIAAFVGISVPTVGAGVMLALGASPRVTLLAFAALVGIGILASAIKLLRGPRRRPTRATAATPGPAEASR